MNLLAIQRYRLRNSPKKPRLSFYQANPAGFAFPQRLEVVRKMELSGQFVCNRRDLTLKFDLLATKQRRNFSMVGPLVVERWLNFRKNPCYPHIFALKQAIFYRDWFGETVSSATQSVCGCAETASLIRAARFWSARMLGSAALALGVTRWDLARRGGAAFALHRRIHRLQSGRRRAVRPCGFGGSAARVAVARRHCSSGNGRGLRRRHVHARNVR
jgi:hypothetical protein